MIITPEELAIHECDEKLLDIINNKTFDDKILYEKQSDLGVSCIIKILTKQGL